MNPLVSVIIPVFNRMDYLPECIRSVRNQSYQKLEIILIDDGSTDGTLELCKQYAQEDPRIRVIAGTHSGVSAARNQGLEQATGTYIFFLDSDDAIHPLLIETMTLSLSSTGAAIAGCWVFSLTTQNWSQIEQLDLTTPGPDDTDYHDHQETVDALFRGRSPLGVIGGVMMRRELIGRTRFKEDLFIGEDYYFIYQNLIKGADAVFLKQRWYYYRSHDQNSDRNPSFDSFWTRFYRRKLVWQSEEALGRTEYANMQKRNAFSVYLTAITADRMSRADQKMMRTVVKQHRKELFPAFRPVGKIRYYLSVYLPFTQRLLNKVRNIVRNRKPKSL